MWVSFVCFAVRVNGIMWYVLGVWLLRSTLGDLLLLLQFSCEIKAVSHYITFKYQDIEQIDTF